MSGPNYQNVNWGLTGACGGLTLGRYAIRWYQSRRFHADDAVHFLAFAVLVVHGGTNQITATAKSQLAVDEKSGSQDVLLAQYKYTNQIGTVNNVFLYLVFWIVKLAFLFFYRLLFKSSPTFIKVWWGVLAFTVATYFIPFAGVLATCSGADSVAAWASCNAATQARATKLEYSCAINVATDVIIMALPLWMIKDLNMNSRQKAGLAFIFSLASFCIALDILRVVEALSSNQALYTILEINMVVIISCLPTYRSLLYIQAKRRERKASRYGYRYGDGYGRSRRSGAGSKALEIPQSSKSKNDKYPDTRPLRDEEAGMELSGPLNTENTTDRGIHVTKAFTVSSAHDTRPGSRAKDLPHVPTPGTRPESCSLEPVPPADEVHELHADLSPEEAAHFQP